MDDQERQKFVSISSYMELVTSWLMQSLQFKAARWPMRHFLIYSVVLCKLQHHQSEHIHLLAIAIYRRYTQTFDLTGRPPSKDAWRFLGEMKVHDSLIEMLGI